MAAKKKPAKQKRTTAILIRCSPAEKRRLEVAARRAGAGASTWLRLLGLEAARALG